MSTLLAMTFGAIFGSTGYPASGIDSFIIIRLSGNPSTVIRGVPFGMISSSNLVLIGWSRPHISQKCPEVMTPSFTNSYASSAIMRIRCVTFIIASSNHRLPTRKCDIETSSVFISGCISSDIGCKCIFCFLCVMFALHGMGNTGVMPTYESSRSPRWLVGNYFPASTFTRMGSMARLTCVHDVNYTSAETSARAI